MFAPGISFWIAAWVLMFLSFVAAFFAIVGGARALDRGTTETPPEENH